MEKRLILILSGILISIIGFVYAFSDQHEYFSQGLSNILSGRTEWLHIFAILPNLLPSIPIIIGGIIITVIGAIYFKEKELNKTT